MNIQKKKYKKIIICIMLLFSIVVGVVQSSDDTFASSRMLRKVRVAFFPMEGFHDIEGNGIHGGMDVKYLEMLSTYANWYVEYVDCDSWGEALEMLANKEVDLVGSAQYSEERAEIYDYASLSSGYTFGAIAISGESTIAYEDFEIMKELTYGMVKNYVREPEFLEYLEDNGIVQPNVKEYEDTEALHKALKAGEVDAIVHTFTEIQEGQKLIGRFAPKPFYYITYKGNDEVLQELNHAISDLKMARPELEAELMNEFYYSRLDVNSLLTTVEKEYINNMKTITVGYLEGFYPFSYEEDGEFKGLTRELLERSFADTNVEFIYKKIESQSDGKFSLRVGDIDVLAYYTDDRQDLNANGLICVNDYAEIPLAIVTKKNTNLNEIKSIATVNALSDTVENIWASRDVYVMISDTQQNCMNALIEDLTDGVLCSAYLAERMLRTDIKYNDLQINTLLQDELPITMILRGNDTELAGILNKTLTEIDAKEINEYLLRENDYPMITIEEFFRDNSMVINTIVLIAIFVAIFIVVNKIRDSKRIQDLMYKDIKMDIWNLNYLIMKGGYRQNIDKKQRFAICYINLAYFRRYNIIYGWNAGEKLLGMVAKALSSFVSKNEICARNQGDRFVLFLEVEDEEVFIERLRDLKAKIENKIYKETENNIPVEMGVYFIPKEGDVDIHLAVSYANQAVDSIAFDKNTDIKVYDATLEGSIKERHARESLLDKVDINKDFVAFYQPKVDIRTNRIIGAEALVRFKDPTENGAIKSPAFFVPYFEQTGRIVDVDFFVFESTCRMLRRRLDAGLEVVTVSCNFSRMHFIKPGFPDQFEEVLNRYNISKDLIEVEITETLVIEELQHHMIKQTLQVLQERGIRLSIDDFGAGYSSLGVFEQIPASVVKLDRSFLLNQVDRERQVKIMRGIVKLSDELEAEVVCEGVETEKDIELMHEIGAFVAQGYFYSKPVPEEEFEQKLNAQEL